MNQNGYCPNYQCNANFDGELVINDFINRYNISQEQALKWAKDICGWNEHGELNRWDNKIGIYCQRRDMTVNYRCFKCKVEFKEPRRGNVES